MPTEESLSKNGTTSSTLLQALRSRESNAWARFVGIYAPIVYRWCRGRGLNDVDSADVIQEVFQAVFKGIARFEHQQAGQSLRGWLWSITRNKICDHFRRRQDQPVGRGGSTANELLNNLADIPEAPAESPESDAAELSRRALLLIQTEFEATTWKAFYAMAIDGISAAEAGRLLGITTAAAFKAKSRVLNRLRRELDGLLD